MRKDCDGRCYISYQFGSTNPDTTHALAMVIAAAVECGGAGKITATSEVRGSTTVCIVHLGSSIAKPY